jgi:hypothetical protein
MIKILLSFWIWRRRGTNTLKRCCFEHHFYVFLSFFLVHVSLSLSDSISYSLSYSLTLSYSLSYSLSLTLSLSLFLITVLLLKSSVRNGDFVSVEFNRFVLFQFEDKNSKKKWNAEKITSTWAYFRPWVSTSVFHSFLCLFARSITHVLSLWLGKQCCVSSQH